MTATPIKYSTPDCNTACVKCGSRYHLAKNPAGYIAIEICATCKPVEKLKKQPKQREVDFDFRRYLR